MRKELRRSLFAAAFGAALVGCGGSAHPPSGSAGSPPPPPPPPPPAVPGTYFTAGRAGFTHTQSTIPFFDNPAVPASAFGLIYADPSNLPLPFDVTNNMTNQLEAGGIGLDVAAVSEYFPTGGTATSWGVRYRVYLEPGGGNTGVLMAVDLRKVGTPPAVPLPVQVSSGTVTGLQLCSLAPTTFDNYSAANLSWVVFHAKGPDNDCGSLDDQYVGFQLAMSASTAPKALAQIEPIEPIYDANGTITGYLAINHPALVGGVPPPNSVQLQQLDANFAAVTTFATKLTGNGSNFAGGDFRSLGVSTGNVWLYVDSSNVYALDLTTGVTTPLNFTLSAGDIVQGRAVFDPADGTKAYAAFASTAAGFVGSYLIRIDTTTKTVTATQARDVAGSGGITLVGATSNNVIYAINDGSGITSVVKSSLTATTSLTGSLTLSALGRVIDDLMGPNGSAGPPRAVFLVGDTVYFTVADVSAVGTTGFAKQAFTVNFNGTATPGAATAVATSVSAVLGVVAPSPIPTSGPIAYSGALVMTGGSNNMTIAGQAAFSNGATSDGWPITQASLGLYGIGGAVTRSIGTLSMNNVANNTPLTQPITGAALNNGPVQAGTPALVELYGKDGTGNPSTDIAIYVTDLSITFTQLSGWGQ
jgi:hypothetical protein